MKTNHSIYFQKPKPMYVIQTFVVCLYLCLSTIVTAADIPGTTPELPSSPLPGDSPAHCETGDPEAPIGCGSEITDVGSSPNNSLQPSSSVGNPINLMSGDKFQSETDFSIPSSQLMFNRMYNSGTTDVNVGLGMGWRHSYAVSIADVGNGAREIIQSNGARLFFSADGTDENGNPLLRSVQSRHGYVVQQDNRHQWHLPDGRTLKFIGSFLVEINWSDQRLLKLFYRSNRLQSVTDEMGRALVFGYTPGRRNELRSFASERFTRAPGHLETVTLPDGSVLEYDYDNKWNLSRVRFPDGTHREYHFENEIYTSHLTGLTDRTGVRFASWSYDENGRAISSEHANGVGKVTQQYPDLKASENGEIVQTIVTNSLGAESTYTWQKIGEQGQSQLLSSTGAGCVTCPITGYDFTYDGDGRLLSRVFNGDGAAVGGGSYSHRYDDQGRLIETQRTSSVGVDRLIERIEYASEFGLLPARKYLPSVNPDSNRIVDFTYNDRGQTMTISESGYIPEFSAENNIFIKRNSRLGSNNMTPSIDSYLPFTRTTQLKYEEGRLAEIDGPRTDVDDITKFRWDSLHRLVEISAPLSPTLRMSEFDANGQTQLIRLGNASPFEIERDGLGSVSAVTHRGMRYGYQHDAEKRLIGMTGPDGQQITMVRDEAGRVVQTVDDVGRVVELEHDSESRLIGQNSFGANGALVNSLEYVFDTKGRISKTGEQRQQGTNDLSIVRSLDYQHDAQNHLSSATDLATGASIDINIDHLLRMTTITRSDGFEQTVQADDLGNTVAMRDARSNTTAFLRDDLGRVVLYDNPDTGFERYWHNEAGHRIKRTREDGSITTYLWDAAGRLIEAQSSLNNNVLAPRGNDGDANDDTLVNAEFDVTTWQYNPENGKLLEARNTSGADQFTYNSDAQLSSHSRRIDGNVFTTRYSYDSRGRQKTKMLPDGQTLLFSYHTEGPNKGSLRAISQPALLGFSENVLLDEIDMDARNGVSGYRTQDGRQTLKTYNGFGDIQSQSIDELLTLNYTYDEAGRIRGIEENGAAQQYDYASQQLVSANTINGDYQYRYDQQGNRLLQNHEPTNGERKAQHYRHAEPGDGNRLIEKTDIVSGLMQSYRYDDNGSPTHSGALQYDYNVDGRPIAVYKADQLIVRYGYNSFGERIKKTLYLANAKPKITYFLYDGTALTAEIAESGHMTAQYVYLNPSQPVLKLEQRGVFSIHTDHIGTPRMMSDENGELVWSANYSPFGEATVTKNIVSLPLRLPGQYFDKETGTHYNYLRDYDPATGRYLTSDPIGLNGGINTYAYANNNPIAFFDTTGLAPAAPPLNGGGWMLTAQQYAQLAALANADRRTEYYFMLHNLTGSRLAFEMSQISSNSEFTGGVAWNANYAILAKYPDRYPTNADGESSIQEFSERIFRADFAAVQSYACGIDGPLYRIPSDSEMVQVTVAAWRAEGLELAAPPLVREFIDIYGDVATQIVMGLDDWVIPYMLEPAYEARYQEAFGFVRDAALEETLNANGFYEPEFIRDHPGDVIETEYSTDCLSKIMKAPTSSRDPNMSDTQLNLYNDVSSSPTHDVIVVFTNGSEYQSCMASQ